MFIIFVSPETNECNVPITTQKCERQALLVITSSTALHNFWLVPERIGKYVL